MLRFTNTLSGAVEDFHPLEPPKVRIYSCGPTVYNYPHIGNYRTFCFVDLLRRYLKYQDYQLHHVMNLTDVDDKTIKGAKAEGLPLGEFTERYARAFFEELALLNCEPVEHYPRATHYIGDMIGIIEKLRDGGFTYERDGSVYFAIERFKAYGRLSKLDVEGIQAGARVDNDEYSKGNPRDFVLWKGRKGDEPFWESPFGEGRPGWHIECSAMSRALLGESLDIHTGAIDLIFPHHENEIAQSECSGSHPFVRYWLHSEFLNLDNRKMSKSEGNIYRLKELLDEGFSPLSIRYALISVHYRMPLQFSFDTVRMADASRQRLQDFLRRVRAGKNTQAPYNPEASARIEKVRRDFIAAMDNDLNISEALGHVFEFLREVNTWADEGKLGAQNYDELEGWLSEFQQVTGMLQWKEEMLDADIQALIDERLAARKARDFKRADALRDQLKGLGIILEDTPSGTQWKR